MERASLSLARALHPDAPAVRVHHQLAEGQAEAGAFESSRHARVFMRERLEEAWQVRLGDAYTGVAHRQLERCALSSASLSAPWIEPISRRMYSSQILPRQSLCGSTSSFKYSSNAVAALRASPKRKP